LEEYLTRIGQALVKYRGIQVLKGIRHGYISFDEVSVLHRQLFMIQVLHAPKIVSKVTKFSYDVL